MSGLHAADWVVLVLYLGGVTLLGTWMARSVHSIADFFMPRRFGKGMMIFSAFGAGTHSDSAVGVASKTFTNGISGIWMELLWLFCTPFYWLIAPIMRRFRATTTADVFELRYDRSVAMLFAVVGASQMSVNMGTMLKGSSALIEGASGGALHADVMIPVMTLLFVIYGVSGGLSAAIVTDYIQGMLTIVFSFMLLPFILNAVGGFAGLRERIADPHLWQLVTAREISAFYVAVLSLNALIGIVVQPHIMGVCAAGRTELDGQWGFMGGNIIKRFCTIAWCLVGFAAIVHFSGREVAPDQVYGAVAREFLPSAAHGLLGIFLAALLAAVMSSCDAFMIASSGLITENLYKPLRPGRPRAHYLLVGRIAAVAVVGVGMLIAYRLPDVIEGLKLFWKVAAAMGLAFWFGFYWRRTTVAGAWAGTLTTFALMYAASHKAAGPWAAGLGLPDSLAFVFVKEGVPEINLPWQMLIYLTGGALATIGVSLATPRVPAEKLERYYALIRTPVGPDEDNEEPCRLPEGSETPPDDTLLPDSDFLVPRPSRQALLGFGAGCVGVLTVLGIIYAVTQLHR